MFVSENVFGKKENNCWCEYVIWENCRKKALNIQIKSQKRLTEGKGGCKIDLND